MNTCHLVTPQLYLVAKVHDDVWEGRFFGGSLLQGLEEVCFLLAGENVELIGAEQTQGVRQFIAKQPGLRNRA